MMSLAAGFVLHVVSILLGAACFEIVWGWFGEPVFKVPITFMQGFGLMLLFRFSTMTHATGASMAGKPHWLHCLVAIVGYPLALFCLWIVHLVMSS